MQKKKYKICILVGQYPVERFKDKGPKAAREEIKKWKNGKATCFTFNTQKELTAFWKGFNAIKGWPMYEKISENDYNAIKNFKTRGGRHA